MSAARVISIESLTPEQAAQQLNCSRQTVYRLVAEGALRAFRLRRGLRIQCDAIEEYKARQTIAVVASAVPIGTRGTAGGGRTSRLSGDSRSRRKTNARLSPHSEMPSSVAELRSALGMRPKHR